jgi:tetratricopeptide (TPR) repeat protein
LLLLALAAGFKPGELRAAAPWLPYETYYRDGYGQLVRTQAAYVPGSVIGYELEIPGDDRGGQPAPRQLNQPKDLFVDDKDQIYIADTGNNRIVQLDENGSFVRQIVVPESPLKSPSGLFIDRSGDIYVADTGNQRIVRLNADGRLLQSFGRPESGYLPASFKFDPVRLVVDKRGFLYVTVLGAYQGLMQLDPEGNLVGFFGPNKVSFSLFDAFKRFVYTREMYQRELKKLPGAIASADIDREGFIYTVTKDIKSGQVKKLNIAGLDQLPGKSDYAFLKGKRSFGETLNRPRDDMAPQLSDISVDGSGNMTVIDAVHNIVSQYDTNGNLLFFWGGDVLAATSKRGVVTAPAAIDSNSRGDLFVLDSANHLIQTLHLSEFGRLVHEANALTQAGRYEESEPLWREVNRLNANYTPALIGLAKAAYHRQDYQLAERLFEQSGVAGGYSDSFWQNRLIWFQKRFGLLMNIALAIGIGYAAWARWAPRLRSAAGRRLGIRRHAEGRMPSRLSIWLPRQLPSQLRHVLYLIRHPVDGFYAIRYEGRAGAASSLILLAASVAAYGYMQAGTRFLFHPSVYVGIDLLPDIAQFVGIWFGWVVAQYLISSLLRGEGRFRDVFHGSSYALFPLILIGAPLTLLSNALTLSEASIYAFLKLAIQVWIALLMVWMVQGVHNYTFLEAVFVSVVSLLALATIVVLLFIFMGLSIELANFVKSIYQEVIVR